MVKSGPRERIESSSRNRERLRLARLGLVTQSLLQVYASLYYPSRLSLHHCYYYYYYHYQRSAWLVKRQPNFSFLEQRGEKQRPVAFRERGPIKSPGSARRRLRPLRSTSFVFGVSNSGPNLFGPRRASGRVTSAAVIRSIRRFSPARRTVTAACDRNFSEY